MGMAGSSLDASPADPHRSGTAVFRLVVQKSRQESAHARSFGGDFELKGWILVAIFGQPT